MDTIVIDKIEYDPYFILGVTFDDPIEHITKEFRRKAKVLHPDKIKGDDKKNRLVVETRTKQFKILVDCYDFIYNQKQSFNFARKNKNEDIRINETPLEINFSQMKLKNPNDYGYEVDRIGHLEGNNFDELKREYIKQLPQPKKLFDKKNFNKKDREEFNAIFEYQKGNFQPETQIIHKTSDGFNGYNSTTLDNCADVCSYNGLLLVGESSRSGMNYSDYFDSFKGPKNPESKTLPKNFKRSEPEKKLTQSETEMQIKMIKGQHVSGVGGSKEDYYLQEQVLLEKQKKDFKEKSEQDKQFILNYKHMFDEQTIQDALNDKLITSKDYLKFE
jgi:curved DNA-binding protein CbpA